MTTSLATAHTKLGVVTMLAIAVMVTSGCSALLPLPGFLGGKKIDSHGPTVAETLKELPVVPETNEAANKPDAAEVLAMYRGVLDRVGDRKQNYYIARRIAELEMEQAELALIEGREDAPYHRAIRDLERLLAEDGQLTVPSVKIQSAEVESTRSGSMQEKALIHYQLAHAYDQTGDQKSMLAHLDETVALGAESDFVIEARFRRAEIRFSAGQHRLAAVDYSVVSSSGGKYQLHALYMLGWSRFKQGDLDLALQAFIGAMDSVLGDSQAGLSYRAGLSNKELLKRSQQELLDDITRVTVITLDYLDGVDSLAAVMEERNSPGWQVQLYRSLGDWYLDKGRFQDSADTWTRFVDRNPLHPEAPAISLKVIEIYRNADFISELAPLKTEFIEHYDKSSEFYAMHGQSVYDGYQQTLLVFLDEITALSHARAQESMLAADYLVAAGWYERWLVNFSEHARASEMQFLLAEAFSDGGEIQASVDAYRLVVDFYPESEHARESAYAILIGLDVLVRETGHPMWDEKIVASLNFTRAYPMDLRTPSIRLNVAKMLFDLSRFQEAVEIAGLVIKSPNASVDAGETQARGLWQKALLISAHSQFELDEYKLAENDYRKLLDYKGADADLSERLLVTVFKQADAAEAEGDIRGTIFHLQRLSEIDSMSTLAIDARYDIAGLYEQLAEDATAAKQLQTFRRDFPQHSLAADIPKRLVSLYEAQDMPELAAEELLAMSASGYFDNETQRQALYRSAELYLSADNTAMAIDSFRNYAHKYEYPFGVRMEAMNHMDDLYQLTGEAEKRRFWLRKKKATFDHASSDEQDDRTRYLAANAAFILATDKFSEFKAVQLKPPLKRSMKIKRELMTQTVKAYQKAADYGVVEYVTGSTFRMGMVYQSLASAILDSELPSDLNDLELGQYEVLLEEQAYPFEEQAIMFHTANLEQGWSIGWDDWVDASLKELDGLSPGRFRRHEIGVAYVESLY